MDAPTPLAQRASPAGLLGYLNFSDGRSDPRFQQALNTAYAQFAAEGSAAPWRSLYDWLVQQCDALSAGGSSAFRDVSQAQAVLRLAFERVPAAYRAHHVDLLAHQTDAALFTPFFLARICEAVLSQAGPWDEEERIVGGALAKLNDYVGHRPIAVLETRPQTELYPHERVRPIPLYIQGAGVAFGRYEAIITAALEILRQTDASLAAEASFDLAAMDELAFDPRGFDYGHPANRRPNYLFGEWDPHVIDNKGRYRRFVVRQVVLDALIRVPSTEYRVPSQQHSELGTRYSVLFEQGAVLAGTILMASGVSGEGPTAYDSDTRLGTLVPRIARYRDAFYTRLLERTPGEVGERLREEAKRLRQPLGGIRQHLNQELARQRAAQLQDRHLALVFADLGYPRASREQAARIPTAGVRMLTEIRLRQVAAELAVRRGELTQAAPLLPEIEDLIHRGIDCGALADPWNILGYQGLYPLFQAREDSVHDTRNDELIEAMARQFDLYARLLAAAASAGDQSLQDQLSRAARRLADWWDQFATYEVSDVPRLRGAERADAALHVARALARWSSEFRTPSSEFRVPSSESGLSSELGTRNSELRFWREYREGFTSAAAFAQVVEALLYGREWRAALALLMTWLSEAENIALAEGDVSFHRLALRWLNGVVATLDGEARSGLVRRFFELLEANGEALWSVPSVPGEVGPQPREVGGEDPFASAYEGVTYRDSTDDGEEGSVIGGAGPGSFPLQEHAPRVERHLRFLKTVARLWQAASAPEIWGQAAQTTTEPWLGTAGAWLEELLALLDQEHGIPVPTSGAGYDEVVEFEKRRHTRDGLIEATLATAVEMDKAVRSLTALLPAGTAGAARQALADWEPLAVEVERALASGDTPAVRKALPRLFRQLGGEALLFVPISEGGHPRPILRAKAALALLTRLLDRLPRLGLLRETYHLIRLAKAMERNGPPEGRKVSEFDQLFRIALRAVVETLLASAGRWDGETRHAEREPPSQPASPATAGSPALPGAAGFTDILRQVAASFLNVWIEHSNTLRLSSLEGVGYPDNWNELRDFIRAYGRELFTAQFMTYANLRGILHRGVGAWLDSLVEADETTRPERLLADMERGKLKRQRAIQFLEVVLHALTEHYEEYKDYNTTTSQSDYGDNLHVLLDFLRIKVGYDRYAWRMQPLVLAHEVLCRQGHERFAEHWRQTVGRESAELSEKLLAALSALEVEHAMRLRTVRDHIEQRFVQPLSVDRLCALIEPAAQAARTGADESSAAFRRLQEELAPLVANPTGAGLDVPNWLRRVEAEVKRFREAEGQPVPTPRPSAPELTLADLQQQLAQWEKPLTGE
jgi:hypothetical protein